MAAKKSSKKAATTARSTLSSKGGEGFTAEERAAMREHARELKAARSRPAGADGTSEVLAKIAAMAPEDRAMGERIHALITAAAPGLTARLWYGMPAYTKNGKVVCFFQDAKKFKSRYATLGFSDSAALDDGEMWPTAFALKELTPAAEARISALVKRAVR
ncbi:MAG TPA: DUF1801 domain-containing protein [Gemmatimonadaceae bacterium]